MDFVVHGTKDGHNILFPTRSSTMPDYLPDIRSGDENEAMLGREAYSISSNQNKIIYSKYIILREGNTSESKRTGFIGFALLLPKSHSLNASRITGLLDKVSDKYLELYVDGNNLQAINESWDFVHNILDHFPKESKPRSFENFKSNNQGGDAFIYFNTKKDLEENWDKGFMQHYSKFKKVLYISEDLKQTQEPLIKGIGKKNPVPPVEINIKMSSPDTKEPGPRGPRPPHIPTNEPSEPSFPTKAVLMVSAITLLISLIIALFFWLPMDSDNDGVKDKIDKCSDTPSGESVDENGCSDSQKDSDNDGVKDDVDKCPDTPNGESVDETGCSDSQKDSDNDGVKDDVDKCPDTPNRESVDETGCSDSQKDSDIGGLEGGGGPPVEPPIPPQEYEPESPLIARIKSDIITKAELEAQKENDDQAVVESVNLYLQLFSLWKYNKEEDYKALYEKVKEDEILKSSELEKYLKNLSLANSKGAYNRRQIDDRVSENMFNFNTLKQFNDIIKEN